jgi:hypothetical protein
MTRLLLSLGLTLLLVAGGRAMPLEEEIAELATKLARQITAAFFREQVEGGRDLGVGQGEEHASAVVVGTRKFVATPTTLLSLRYDEAARVQAYSPATP